MTQHTKVLIIGFLSMFVLAGAVVKRGPRDRAPLYFTKYVENPVVETFETIHHFRYAATASSIHCQCRGTGSPTATMAWDLDDGSPISVDAGTIVCDAEESDTTLTGDTSFDVGDDLDLRITAIGGTTVTDCSFQIYFH